MYSSNNGFSIGTIIFSAISRPFNGLWLSCELSRDLLEELFVRFAGLSLAEIEAESGFSCRGFFVSSLETLIWAKTDEFGIKLDELELD